jgi:hypothetical protein
LETSELIDEFAKMTNTYALQNEATTATEIRQLFGLLISTDGIGNIFSQYSDDRKTLMPVAEQPTHHQ